MKSKSLVNKVLGTITITSFLAIGYNMHNLYKLTDQDYQLSKSFGYSSKGNPNKENSSSFFYPKKESEALQGMAASLATFVFCLYYSYKKED